MNEKIYFKFFWLIGLGVGGGATSFREWDVKLIQLLISIVLHKLEAVAAGLKANLCKGPYKCTGLTAPALKSWPQKWGVHFFFFSVLSWSCPVRQPFLWWYASSITVARLQESHAGAGRSLGISQNGRTCSDHVWEPCQSRNCAFVVAGPKLVSEQPIVFLGFGWNGWFVQDRICARPAAQVLPAWDQHPLADPAQHLWQKRESCGPSGGMCRAEDFCSLPGHRSSCSLAVSKMHQQLRMIF